MWGIHIVPIKVAPECIIVICILIYLDINEPGKNCHLHLAENGKILKSVQEPNIYWLSDYFTEGGKDLSLSENGLSKVTQEVFGRWREGFHKSKMGVIITHVLLLWLKIVETKAVILL